MDKDSKKKIAYKLIKSLHNDDNSLSVTLTGSYSEHFDSNKAGDIDIVIICKKLNKTFFDRSVAKLKVIKKKYFNEKKNLIINSTFGPIKFYTKNSIVFHLMIYDLKSHIDHTIKSPFTCYDWERSGVYVGKSLKELSPVLRLQFRDFSEARRSTQEYLNDISRNRISYREYNFKNKKIELKKKYFIIDKVNRRDFIYHIIKFLLINFIKYEKDVNSIIAKQQIEKKFLDIVKNKKNLKKFKKLIDSKNKKSENIKTYEKKLALNFIIKFEQYIKKKDKTNKIFFSRHKKTNLNNDIFLGQELNPKIIDKKINKEFNKINIYKCFSSPLLRCIETASLIFKKNQIVTNKYLKEIDYGKAEGLNFKKLNQKYPQMVKMWNKGLDPRFPKGESTFKANDRLKKFIKHELKGNKIGKKRNVAVFTHNVILRCLIGSFYKIDKRDWYKINIPYFSPLEFRLNKNKLSPNIDRKKFLLIFKNFY